MMRLNRYLASAGVAARRKADLLIEDGLVEVNGVVTKKMGTIVDETKDIVTCRGQKVYLKKAFTYLALHKPVGYVTTVSRREGPSIMGLIPRGKRLYPVGRLDKDSSGLIIMTDDGDSAQKIMHPSFNLEKEYFVVLDKPLADKDRKKIEAGMTIDGKKLQPARIISVSGNRVDIAIHEGVNRHIRRLFGRLDYRVDKLKRIRIGKLKLEGIEEGKTKAVKLADII